MSERILNALIQLFAIIAKIDEVKDESQPSKVVSSTGYNVIRSFLLSEMSAEKVDQYLALFDHHLNVLRLKSSKQGIRKQTSVNSVKVLRICSEINEELNLRQKFVVLTKILELIIENDVVTNQERAFVQTVSETFNIQEEEFTLIQALVLGEINEDFASNNEKVIIATEQLTSKAKNWIHIHGLSKNIPFVHIESINQLFYRVPEGIELLKAGQPLREGRVLLLHQGTTLKTKKSQPIYHSDILNQFLRFSKEEAFTFEATNLSYSFTKGKVGIQPINFKEESGKLIGIMGGSGTGKSTLINLFNGALKPSSGVVTINGIDIHQDKDFREGIIGYVSQDDLLIEELNVFENLYFATRLAFRDKTKRELKRMVVNMLHSLGLYEIKNLKVGNPLEKIISGGQRKRLNIALELIRKPSILFVDEPTSGLSSRDSLNIMNLLKELSFKGNLIFVVIHQPSSEIFKLFDRLLLMDTGGYPIFDGNPTDALVYFKEQIHHVNADERECPLCGNVNPEQIFDIVEAKVINEFGATTAIRKTEPKIWYERYRIHKTKENVRNRQKKLTPKSHIPGWVEQFKVFFTRDILSKISNKQYILITLLEAPLLAIVLSFFLKFFDPNNELGNYSYFKNENIPQYIFISIVVSMFLGMTVAAEEINRDKKILKREAFLNLSRSSYLISKVSIMLIVSLIQSFLFVLIGNSILEIKGMFIEYWFILFTTSVWANLIGLNISSAFNIAKVIYILVPILIIPQLLFSGAIVKFDKLHPSISHPTEVPWLGNIMTSRWAYEALAVEQSVANELSLKFYDLEQQESRYKWRKDYWIPEMRRLLGKKINHDIIRNEILKLNDQIKNLKCTDCIIKNQVNIERTNRFLNIIRAQSIMNQNRFNDSIEALKMKIGETNYFELKETYLNEALENLVTNRFNENKIVVDNKNRVLLQTDDAIYTIDNATRLLDAPFYSPYKFVFGIGFSTYFINALVIWLFTFLCYIALYYNWLRRVIEYTRTFGSRKK